VTTRAWIDGRAAGADALAALMAAGEGHFTTLQVRNGAVQGLPLHLQRLGVANRSLFGQDLGTGPLRDALLAAWLADGRPSCTLRASVHALRLAAPDGDRASPTLRVLVTTAPANHPGRTPLSVKTVRYCRHMPEVKHLGLFPLLHHRRVARAAGFDDALFVDRAGVISEGSLWNIGFRSAEGIVWPQARALRGTRQQLLEAAFAEAGVAQRHATVHVNALPAFTGAFATNARGVQPIASIDGVAWPDDGPWQDWLRARADASPWEPLDPGP